VWNSEIKEHECLRGLGMFSSPFFAIFVIIHPVYIIFPCSFFDSGPSYDILDLKLKTYLKIKFSSMQGIKDSRCSNAAAVFGKVLNHKIPYMGMSDLA